MTAPCPFLTVEAAGLLTPPAFAGWLFVQTFRAGSIRDRCNLAAIIVTLDKQFGRTSFAFAPMIEDGKVVEQYLLVRPDPAVIGFAAQLLDLTANGRDLDPGLYQEKADQVVGDLWTDAPLSLRVATAQAAGVPADSGLLATPLPAIVDFLARIIDPD